MAKIQIKNKNATPICTIFLCAKTLLHSYIRIYAIFLSQLYFINILLFFISSTNHFVTTRGRVIAVPEITA